VAAAKNPRPNSTPRGTGRLSSSTSQKVQI
jgi:hypothetical protein